MSEPVQPPPSSPPYPAHPPMDLNYQGIGPVTVDRDAEQLRILAICWYVLSGLTILFGCIPIPHLAIGLAMIFAPSFFGPGSTPPAFVGWFFVGMASAFMLMCWTCAVLGFFAARGLQMRRWLTVCYVAAAVACLQVLFGTLLGVFTFIVLGRPSAKAHFERAAGRA